MNQCGQTFSVFKLAVFAIIALVLLYIATTFFAAPQHDAVKELRDAVENAQANEGSAFTSEILLENGFALDAQKIFDTGLRSVSFQCNSSDCVQKKLDTGPRNLVVNEKISTLYTTRCVFEKSLFNCKIYFGTPPAQLEIKDFSLKENFDLESEAVELGFLVKNNGKQNAIGITAEVKVYRVENQEQNLYSEPIAKEIALLEPEQGFSANFVLPIKEAGNYLVEARVSGADSGSQLKKSEFSASGTIVASDCATSQKLETFLNETLNKCISRYTCTGCEYSFECAQKWSEQLPRHVFEESTKENALEITEPANGNCE